MITRKTRKLFGPVKSVDAKSAEFEISNGKTTEVRQRSDGYEKYDLQGRLVEEISPYRLMTEDSYKDIYFYDVEGNLVSRDEYKEDGSLLGKTTFEKLEDGNRIEKNFYYDNENLKIGIHSIYDSENNHIETSYYDEKGNVDPRHIYQSSLYSSRKVEENISYNTNEYIVEASHYDENGNYTHRTVTSYDLKDNQKDFSSYDLNENLVQKTRYVYEFDSSGNWIERLQYWWVIGWGEFNLRPWAVTRRKIKYY
jgi:hypothetical protein